VVIKRFNPVSVGKLAFFVYAIIGLIVGAFVSLAGLVAGGVMANEGLSFFPMLFGQLAIIVLPIVYGCIGAITGMIGAVVYNVVAGKVGGIEVEVA
jgi:hypothetical protein